MNDSIRTKIVQISDTHIHARPGARLLGFDVDEGLRRVVAHIRARHADARLLLCTGDLVHDDGAPAYERLRALLAPLERPVYCLPGNHDDAVILSGALSAGPVRRERHIHLQDWQVVLLDSTVPGHAGGHLREGELAWLDRTLRAHRTHALVCLHHHPVAVGSPWMDTMMVDNAGALLRLLERHPHVRGVAWGHVHQEFQGRMGTVHLYGTPATCMQFRPGAEAMEVDGQAPGYRWFELSADGAINSGVERVD